MSFNTKLNTSVGIRMGAKIKKRAQKSLIRSRGGAFLARPLVLPVAAFFAPFGRENDDCAHLECMLTQIRSIQVAVFGIVSHFLADSFTGCSPTKTFDSKNTGNTSTL